MTAPVELRAGAATDVGLVREVNEDSFLSEPPVFVVADGMGGHDGGDIASQIVVEEFAVLAEAGYDPRRGPEAVTATLQQCQRRLDEYGDSPPRQGRRALARRDDRRGRVARRGSRALLAVGQPR